MLWWNHGSAVYGFLIISGYSIGASLERSPGGFYMRRFWRIFPTYVVSLVLAFLAGLFIVTSVGQASVFFRPTLGALIIALLMLQSFVGPTISTDGQLWTIAIEWWNYMLAPLFRRCSAALLMSLIAFSLFLYLKHPPPADPSRLSNGYLFAVLTWLWLVGFLYHRWGRRPLGYAILFLPFVIAVAEGPPSLSTSADWAWLGVFAVALCETVRVPRFLTAPMNWLGELSYPLYAMHVPVIVVCTLLHIYSIPVILIAVVLASVATLHIVDLPLRRWGVAFCERLGALWRRPAPAASS